MGQGGAELFLVLASLPNDAGLSGMVYRIHRFPDAVDRSLFPKRVSPLGRLIFSGKCKIEALVRREIGKEIVTRRAVEPSVQDIP